MIGIACVYVACTLFVPPLPLCISRVTVYVCSCAFAIISMSPFIAAELTLIAPVDLL